MKITMPLEDVVVTACERVEELRPAYDAAVARAEEAKAQRKADKAAANAAGHKKRDAVRVRYEGALEYWTERLNSRPTGWFSPSLDTWMKRNPKPQLLMHRDDTFPPSSDYDDLLIDDGVPAYFHEIERLSKISISGSTITLELGLYAALFPMETPE